MNEIIKITSLSKYGNGIICLISYTEKGELEVFYANKHIIGNMLLSPGDTVKIEYLLESGKADPEDLTKVQYMSLKAGFYAGFRIAIKLIAG